jgi:putative endonuclease
MCKGWPFQVLRKFISKLKRVLVALYTKVFGLQKKSGHIDLGKLGEDLAVDFLKKRKLKILKRNWFFQKGEIDIIALDRVHDVVVFVEVRLRSHRALVSGYFSITSRKKDIIRKTCRAYLRRFVKPETVYRFDVIEVRFNREDNSHEISHYENVRLF